MLATHHLELVGGRCSSLILTASADATILTISVDDLTSMSEALNTVSWRSAGANLTYLSVTSNGLFQLQVSIQFTSLHLICSRRMDTVQECDTEGKEAQCELFAKATSDEKEELDPRGDLVLIVQQRHLLVSSRVLELSCPFFEKMLQSNAFREGVDQPNAEQPPTKRLQEDHPDAFSLMCRVLHYRPVDSPDSVDGYNLLADLCNFYGCWRALSFYVRAWLESWDLSKLSSQELQQMLWVSFVFHLVDEFGSVSLHLAEVFTIDEWKAWEPHPMPAH